MSSVRKRQHGMKEECCAVNARFSEDTGEDAEHCRVD